MAIEIINPDYSGEPYNGPERVAACTSGVAAIWAPLDRSGEPRPIRYVFDGEAWEDAEREDCEAWVERHRSKMRQVAACNIGTRVLPVEVDSTYGPEPDKEDLRLINQYALEELEAADVYVRRMRLVHDDYHKDYLRFSRASVRQMVDTVPGRSILEGHDTSRAGLGLMFRAEVKREAMRTDGYAYFYMPRSVSERETTLIDAGVWRYVSVGFSYDWIECDLCNRNYMGVPDENGDACPHYLGETYDVDELPANADLENYWLTDDEKAVYCTAVFRGKTTTREGSIVYLGALEDAEIVRAAGITTDFVAQKREAVGVPDKRVNEGQRPYENEHACRLRDPDQYERIRSEDGEIDGKPVRNLIGYTAGGGSDRQAIRFPTESWDAGDARAACRERDGTFEPASGDESAALGESGQSMPEDDPTSGEGDPESAKERDSAMADEKTVDDLREQLDERDERIEELKQTVDERADEIRELKDTLEATAEREAAFRADLVAELDRLAGLTGNEAVLEAWREVAAEDLSGLSPERLLAVREEWADEYDERRPTPQSSAAETDEPETDDDDDGDEAVDARNSSLL